MKVRNVNDDRLYSLYDYYSSMVREFVVNHEDDDEDITIRDIEEWFQFDTDFESVAEDGEDIKDVGERCLHMQELCIDFLKKLYSLKKKFNVEMTEEENGYGYTGEWDSDFCQDYFDADTEEEAIELAKAYLRDNGCDPDIYIFRAHTVE